MALHSCEMSLKIGKVSDANILMKDSHAITKVQIYVQCLSLHASILYMCSLLTCTECNMAVSPSAAAAPDHHSHPPRMPALASTHPAVGLLERGTRGMIIG